MITLGIDLSAEPKKTGYARVTWASGRACVRELDVGASNERLLELMDGAAKVGIDCPLGWPGEFVDFVTAHRDRRVAPNAAERIASRDNLAMRATDRFVREHGFGQPLSVSTDRIGRAAMRVAGLLSALEAQTGKSVDRSGRGIIVEVYPAAALRRWRFDTTSYKTDADRRRALVDTFFERSTTWLEADPDYRAKCEKSDDAFDALVAALNARAASMPNGTHRPADGDEDAAAIEGWIAVPKMEFEDLRPDAHL